jgi:hypothetical protein
MAKLSGLGSGLIVGTTDLSGDIGEMSEIGVSRANFPVPAINQQAMDRVLLRKDGNLAFQAYWDFATSHPVLAAIPRTDIQVTYFHGTSSGTAVGDVGASLVAKQATLSPTFGADGSLVVGSNFTANGYGLEWSGGGTGDGLLTTGKQSFATGTVNGSSINLGAVSTLFGAAAYLHVLTMPSGTATFAVQDSDDDISFLDVTGMVFAALTAPGVERVQGAVNATVRQYVRLQGRGVHGTSLVVCNFIRYLSNPNL